MSCDCNNLCAGTFLQPQNLMKKERSKLEYTKNNGAAGGEDGMIREGFCTVETPSVYIKFAWLQWASTPYTY